ncbi:MAG: glutamate ABC transporter substrate-binding protein [Lapillicoccus sp.]
MRIIRRRAPALAAAAGAAILLAACSSGTPVTQVTGGDAASAKITIGISFDQPGLGLKTGDNTYSGFDVDTAVYVAKQLGYASGDIAWKRADPGDRETLLMDGEVDLVFSTYSITAARKQKVDFAGPYFVAHQDLLVRRNDVITGPETLDGKTLCSVTGTTSADLVQKQFLGRITLVPATKFSDCVTSLVAGQVDAVTTDDVILAGFAAQPQYKGVLKVVGKGFSDENYGVGIKKDDTQLVSKVDAALKKYIDDGSWKASLDATVGPSGYAIPSPPTPGA